MKTTKQTGPYGSWSSPLTAESIAQAGKRLAQPECREDGIYWLEGRPSEGGRNVLCRWRDGESEDLTPKGYSVKTRAQEYGGAPWCVCDAKTRYFVEDSDQGIYRQSGGDISCVIKKAGARFGDLQWDEHRQRIIAVRETDPQGDGEPVASIVAIDEQGRCEELVSGADFFTAPRMSPDGRRFAWLEWDHPNMPWDHNRLMVAEVTGDGRLARTICIAGREAEAIFQPEWLPKGELVFVSDREHGWWNHHVWDGQSVTRLHQEEAEFALPYWQFGMKTWGLDATSDRIITARNHNGIWSLCQLDQQGCTVLNQDWTSIQHCHAGHGQAVMLAGRGDHPLAVVNVDPASGDTQVLASAAPPPSSVDYLSQPETLECPVGDGETVHAFYYPPSNPEWQAAPDEKPPVLVKCHGGPTGATDTALDPRIQFWTSRGIAVVDINYRGSTGYGRAYRHRLYGSWGKLDVEDCLAVIDHLDQAGRIDPKRCLISGSSAGGYTVLAALTFTEVFAAGASYYGIGDLAALDAATHKFESRYTEKLIGPLPEMEAEWRARSPIHHVERLTVPVIFFQGDQDKVVPPEQASQMADALRSKGQAVAHVLFEGEAHGFRQAKTIQSALEMELSFYGQMLGFSPFGSLTQAKVENL